MHIPKYKTNTSIPIGVNMNSGKTLRLRSSSYIPLALACLHSYQFNLLPLTGCFGLFTPKCLKIVLERVIVVFYICRLRFECGIRKVGRQKCQHE